MNMARLKQTTDFLEAFGLTFKGVRVDQPTCLGVNIVTASFEKLLRSRDSNKCVVIGDCMLKQLNVTNTQGQRNYQFTVYKVDGDEQVELGSMQVYVRPVAKTSLVLLEPA